MSKARDSAQLTPAVYIVATPIGNLKDISLRAKQVLSEVDLIGAEDTRHSKSLLQYLGIDTQMIALHQHNEEKASEILLRKVQEGLSVALISDAGTPLISDPGYQLVDLAHKLGISVIPVPGPCAITCALSISGLSAQPFVFEGFLPVKSVAKLKFLQSLSREHRTMVFYEAPHRVLDTLQVLRVVFGESREIVFLRELTKKFETIVRGTIDSVLDVVSNDKHQQKGEIVLVVKGAIKEKNTELPKDAVKILETLMAALPHKQAIDLAGEITGQRKNLLYQAALKLKKT